MVPQVLDVFYYPERADDWLACPPHMDPGLVTLVASDAEGLEALAGSKTWVPLGSNFHGAALVGSEWSFATSLSSDCPKCQPCLHRVTVKRGMCRVSVALELRLSAQSRKVLAQRRPEKDESRVVLGLCSCPVNLWEGWRLRDTKDQ